ncbi:DUF3632 domain-containing protein [Aspergillus alliaceus]|uniref:DUF3632 domain-containing protein n=1 Tax=Petromyces alliaceus TaxID=209559 RepID=UPI0012A438CB|nr:uncharacterized protein BDW43DRAFT_247831 [Aspergillus alliaceus]KAB8227349.1 hypothetical protein BDW43DRAFT_247831 [Aspergillus alliaceus]
MTAPRLHLESYATDNPLKPELELFIILKEYLQSSDVKSSAAAAAQKINSLVPTRRASYSYSDDVELFLWSTWGIFIHVAKQIPHDHPWQGRLVELIRSLTVLVPIKVEIWEKTRQVWTDLPIFGPSMREAWISPTYDSDRSNTDEVDQWINLNSFAARLLNLDAVLWISFAVWALRDALDEPVDGPELDCNVRVAIEWITHSGRCLYQYLLSPSQDVHGCDGLSLEVWQRWKRRFKEVSEVLGTDSRQMAVQTTIIMENIERSMEK